MERPFGVESEEPMQMHPTDRARVIELFRSIAMTATITANHLEAGVANSTDDVADAHSTIEGDMCSISRALSLWTEEAKKILLLQLAWEKKEEIEAAWWANLH